MNTGKFRVSLGRIADVATVSACAVALYLVVSDAKGAVEPPKAERGSRTISPELSARATSSGLSRGDPNANVVLTEFGDYECPGCRHYERFLSELLAKWPTELRINWRHFPLSYHDGAVPAARAAGCAHAQGRFAEFHEVLFRDQRWKWNPQDAFRAMAASAGIVDSAAFESCLGDLSETAEIVRDRQLAEEIGLTSTPSFVLNGVLLRPGVDSAELDSLVAATIGRARQ